MTTRATAGRPIRAGALFVADAAAVASWPPRASTLFTDLAHPQGWVDRVGVDVAAAQLAGAALWITSCWLGLGLLAALVAGLPGRSGYRAGQLAHHLLPRVLRRLIAGSLGLSVVLVPVAAQAAGGTSHRPSAVAAAALGPVAGRAVGPVAGRAVGPATVPASGPAGRAVAVRAQLRSPVPWPSTPPVPGPLPHDDTVLVHPNDSLWLIAARRLGPRPSPARIAVEWPAWYRANAALIGPDPDVIHPGQHLLIPSSADTTAKGSPQ